MSDLEQDEKPRRYVGTIGHVSNRKSLMTAAIMKLLAEAGTKQEAPVMAEEQTKPTAWKSATTALEATKPGDQIVCRKLRADGTFYYFFAERRVWGDVVAEPWLVDNRLAETITDRCDAWTAIPS